MRLRYGTSRIVGDEKAVFSYPCIAKYLGVPLKRIVQVKSKYDREKRMYIPSKKPHLTEEQKEELTCDEYM